MVTDEQNHSIAMGVALMCLYNGFIGEKSVTHGATPPSVFFAHNLRLLHVCFVQQPPLITHQQGQTGLSTVGAAHSLAVDRLGWIC